MSKEFRYLIQMEKEIKNLKTEYIGKGKHYLPFDLPDKISDSVLRFVNGFDMVKEFQRRNLILTFCVRQKFLGVYM